MVETLSLKVLGDAITSFWGRSALVLWCLATSCLVALVALAAGAYWHVADAAELLAAYGTVLSLALLVLVVFASFKTYAERPQPILSLIPDEAQSFWGQSRQPDGRITTQLALRFQATNLTDGSIMLSGIELCRPFVRPHEILTKMMIVRHPNGDIYSSQNPILPHSLTKGSATIIIDRPVGSIGKMMRAVVRVQDHAGRWHKLIFRHLPMIGKASARA